MGLCGIVVAHIFGLLSPLRIHLLSFCLFVFQKKLRLNKNTIRLYLDLENYEGRV